MADPWYATRTEVLAALGGATTSSARQIDRNIASASRGVDTLCHRRFWPCQGVRTLDWPNDQLAAAGRYWLDDLSLVSVTAVLSGGTDITTGVLLRPDTGPPFTYLEVDRGGAYGFSSGSSSQRSLSITGVWGYTLDETPVTVLAEALDSSETYVDVADSSRVGVGALLRVDTERMIVTDQSLLDTGQTLVDALPARANATTLTVQDGSVFAVDELIVIGPERMLVQEVAGNTVLVDRRVEGLGALLEHDAGAQVYAPRALTVERGAAGTTAAAHSTAAPVLRWMPPPLVHDLTIAEAINRTQQEQAGYGRTIGSGDNQSEMSGRQIGALRADVRAAHGRLARTRAV